MVLRQGDNDSKRIWGGSLRPTLTGSPVAELQAALIAIGTLTYPADGHFGPHTEHALRRFQWYVAKVRYRLQLLPGNLPASGTICHNPPGAHGTHGICDAGTGRLIDSWKVGNFVTTSPLVRLNVNPLSNVETSETFKTLSYPSAKDDEVLVHADFASVIGTMNEQAKKANVVLEVNQTFRRHNIPPTGAVVPPAAKSQHLVGHAVDLNIVDGSTVNTTAMFISGNETDNADDFIAAVKTKGLRWGGDFSKPDPPHFDDYLNPNSEDYDMTFFFAQRCFDKQHPMRVVQ